ncbi:MAG: efflux RND transporter periplasmic adaptor subunit [Chitinophagaceae bacterium]
MKTIFNIAFAALFLIACGDNSTLDQKKKELEKLKQEEKSVQGKIKTLEAEIAKLDTSKKIDEDLEIAIMPVKSELFKTYIDIQGRVDADENVSLSTQMPGVITRINVKPGDQVSKGQVLAETDINALLQQISDLETNLALAKQAFTKQQNLWKQNIGTEMQFLQAKTTKESLEKKMSAMNEQVRMSKIISPISGTVDAVNIKIAQMVAPGMGAINVVNFNNLKVKADLAETYSSRVKNGNTVQIYFPDINDSITAKINYAARAINPMTRTFTVEVLLPANAKFHPNMVAKLKINDYQSAKPVITVPVKYIQKNNDESFVLVEENNVAVKKIITIAKEYNGIAELKSGLSEGDKVITEGYDLINAGDKIKVKSTDNE